MVKRFRMASPATLGGLLLAALLLTACGSGPGDSWAGLASDPGRNTVYVAYSKTVVAFDSMTGETRWKYPDKDHRDASFYAVPVADNGTVFVGDYKGRLHSINAEDGTANWIYEPDKETIIGPISLNASDRVISGVAVNGNKVFFGMGSRNVVAVSRQTAEEVWTFETNHGVWATPLYIPADSEAGITQDTLYVVSLDHYLYAIDPETGDQLWRKDLGGAAPGGMAYDPVLNRVYVGTFVSEMLAIDLNTHEIVDRFDTEDWLWGHPALEIGEDGTETLYFGDLSGYLYAARVTTEGFEQVWKRKVASGAIRAAPLLVDDMVIVGSKNDHIYAVSKVDGTEKWDKKTRGQVLSELVAAPQTTESETPSDLVIIGTTDKDKLVIAYQSASGDEVWDYKD